MSREADLMEYPKMISRSRKTLAQLITTMDVFGSLYEFWGSRGLGRMGHVLAKTRLWSCSSYCLVSLFLAGSMGGKLSVLCLVGSIEPFFGLDDANQTCWCWFPR